MQSNFFDPLEPRGYFSTVGSLDPTFGTGGIAAYRLLTSTNDHPAIVTGAVEQKGGKFVVATPNALLRFNRNGSIDTSFGSGGTIPFPSISGSFAGIALQHNGKLIVEESVNLQPFTPTQTLLARYDLNRNGMLDTSFKGNVFTGRTFTDNLFTSIDLAVQRDDKIVVVGSNFQSTGSAFEAVYRLRADGSLDTSFGNQGMAVGPTVQSPVATGALGVAVRADGMIDAVTFIQDADGSHSVYDIVLNSRGRATTIRSPRPRHSTFQPPTTNVVSTSIIARPDGLFVSGGYSGGSVQTARGPVVPVIAPTTYVSFQGQATASPVFIQGIAATRRNQIVIGGYTSTGWTLERYTANQKVDSSFGNSGVTTVPLLTGFANVEPQLQSVLTTADGHVLAFGTDFRDLTMIRLM